MYSCQSPSLADVEENSGMGDEDQLPYQAYSFNDSSSTTFSSRAATPMEEPINENVSLFYISDFLIFIFRIYHLF